MCAALVQKPGPLPFHCSRTIRCLTRLLGGKPAGCLKEKSARQFVCIQKGKDTFAMDLNQYYGQGEEQILGWLGGEVAPSSREDARCL